MKELLKFFDRPIAFNRFFVTLTGSINAALMLSQAVYWAQRTSLEGGWFYKSQKEWEDETGLTRHQQDGARQRLRELGFLEERVSGVPATVHFRLNAEKLQSSLPKTGNLDCRKPASKSAGKRQTITETTQETTSDTSSAKDKPSQDGDGEVSLHHLFRQDFDAYYRFKMQAPAPWDGKEGAQLSRWMKANPTITRDQWRVILTNRARSPVSHAKRLSVWIDCALAWLNGLADDWGKPITGNGGKNGAVSRGKTDSNLAVLQELNAEEERANGAAQDGLFPASDSDEE